MTLTGVFAKYADRGDELVTAGLRRALVLAVLLFSVTCAHAEEANRLPWEKFGFVVGGFIVSSDTELRVDSATGIGVSVDLEDSLGLDSKLGTYRIGLMYRPGNSRRHQIEFQYFESSRSGDKTLDNDLEIGDKFFPAGTTVHSELGLRFLNVDYSYAFLQDERVRLAVSAGVHTTDVKFSIESSETPTSEDESFTAPLPVIGLRADFVLTPRWRFKSTLDLMYLEYRGLEGVLTDAYVGIEYLAFKNIGFGFGLNGIRYRVEGDGNDPNGMDFKGVLQLDLDGAVLYARYFF
ncbi:MAG: hypothetical protein JSW48_05710 [Betaproteobacteria bacterium]|nr:MAG: hypothetical protein JSW48_05710 [Betaproteobacteria bacterium]